MSVESRVRTATEATAATISQIRTLTLPEDTSPAGRPMRSRPRRVHQGWLVPLTAAVAVIAVAAILVAVRDLPGTNPARPPLPPASSKPVAIPRYAGLLVPKGRGRFLAVTDTRTGATLARVTPLRGYTMSGVAVAADDRTYVIDEVPLTARAPHVWWLLRFTPGTPIKMSELTHIKQPGTTPNLGFAVSPDGHTVAVLSVPHTGTGQSAVGTLTLQTFSLVTGLPLHTWTAPKAHAGGEPPAVDIFATMSWLSDNRTLAFQTYRPAKPDTIYLLDTTSTGRSLFANSRPVLTMPPVDDSTGLGALLTPDGRTAVCFGGIVPGKSTAAEFTACSTLTGKLERVLY